MTARAGNRVHKLKDGGTSRSICSPPIASIGKGKRRRSDQDVDVKPLKKARTGEISDVVESANEEDVRAKLEEGESDNEIICLGTAAQLAQDRHTNSSKTKVTLTPEEKELFGKMIIWWTAAVKARGRRVEDRHKAHFKIWKKIAKVS